MYQNVEIEYIHGRTATLYIYDDGVEVEQVILSDYGTRDDMHALFVEKGFIKKSPEEIAQLAEQKRSDEHARDREQSVQRRKDAAARRERLEQEAESKKKKMDDLLSNAQAVPNHVEL